MALTANLVAQAVSEIMSGINLGVQNAADYVDAVRPPERVVFTGDIITGLNEIPREVVEDGTSKVTSVYDSGAVTREEVYLDGVYNHTNLSVELPSISTQTLDVGVKTTRFFEDNAVEILFVYPGVKSSSKSG
jgi:hypothetical protein